MNTLSLGQLTTVDLRDVFIGEASHFTPWLAQEQNLALLSETIGLDLELVGIEQNVGPYRADIVCKDTLTGNTVLIENQLEKTNHTHLGQILTYAAKFHAVAVVWIASRFTEEHRAALDWLNTNTVSEVNFFGLEIELWRIGTSPAAPKFNIVSQPNEWVKVQSTGLVAGGELTETGQWQLEYWTAFREYLLAHGQSVIKPRHPWPRSWIGFAIGRSDFQLAVNVHQIKQYTSVALEISGVNKTAYYHLLKDEKADIERGLGQRLEWNEAPGKKSSSLRIYLHHTNPTDRLDWPRQHQWILSHLEALHKVFSARIKMLHASEWNPLPGTLSQE